jgi:hypothetical protein
MQSRNPEASAALDAGGSARKPASPLRSSFMSLRSKPLCSLAILPGGWDSAKRLKTEHPTELPKLPELHFLVRAYPRKSAVNFYAVSQPSLAVGRRENGSKSGHPAELPKSPELHFLVRACPRKSGVNLPVPN